MCEIDKQVINHVIQLCEANKIDVSKKFVALRDGVCYGSEVCADCAQVAQRAVYLIFARAFCKETIDSESKKDIKNILAEWSTLEKTENNAVAKKEYFEIMQAKYERECAKNEGEIKMKKVVLKYVNETLDVLQIRAKSKISDAVANAIQIAKESLEEARGYIENVKDEKSKTANSLAKEIADTIKSWRCVSLELLTAKKAIELKAIVETAKSWSEITQIPTGKNIEKAENIISYTEDSKFLTSVNMIDVVEEFNAFKFQLTAKKEERENKRIGFENEMAEYDRKISDVVNEIIQLRASFDNGRITKQDAANKLMTLKNKKESAERGKQLKMNAHNMLGTLNNSVNEMIEKLEMLVFMYDEMNDYSTQITYDLFQTTDLNSCLSVLQNVASQEDAQNVIVAINTIVNVVKMTAGANEDILKIINRSENRRSEKEEVVATEKEVSLDDLFASALGETTSQTVVQQQNNVDKFLDPLGDIANDN